MLVNNAGTSWLRPLDELTEEDWEAQWQLNVRGPERLMRAAAPRMAEQGWGRIVNVASSSGKRPSLRNAAYSVTKAAQLSLSRAYADAYAAQGVLVNAVAPGDHRAATLWMGRAGSPTRRSRRAADDRKAAIARAAAKVPLGRFGEPEEIAAVIVFLCSERASDVAGAAWSVDGGAVPIDHLNGGVPHGGAPVDSRRRTAKRGRSPVPVNTSAVGKQYPPVVYAVGREKVKEYASAVGETNPLHLDAGGRARRRPRRRRRAADVRRRLPVGRRDAGDLRPRGRDQLRDDGAQRAGLPLGARRRRRRGADDAGLACSTSRRRAAWASTTSRS